MKKIREYHVEAYWAEQAAKKEKRAEIKEKAVFAISTVVLFLLNGFVAWGVLDLIFEVL